MIIMTRKSKTATAHVSPNHRAFNKTEWEHKNEVLDITPEHPSSEYNFERKFQDKLFPSNQSLKQPE